MKKRGIGFLFFVLGILFIIPTTVFADEFDVLLTNNKLVVKSFKPQSIDDAWVVVYERYIEPKGTFWANSSNWMNEDYTKATVYYDPNSTYGATDVSKVIDVEYVYDEEIKAVVDELIEGLGNASEFELSDIDFINYLMNESSDSSFVNYSSKLRKAIKYKNFSIDIRLGTDAIFLTEKGGNALFTYDDTVYYVKGMTLAFAKHIIYVDTDESNPIEAAKTRLKEIFGTDFSLTDKGTITDFLQEKELELQKNYTGNPLQANSYAQSQMNTEYYNPNAPYHFILGDNVHSNLVELTFGENKVKFVIVKDSTKVNNKVELITNDVGTDITVSSDNATIPFDTLIKVKKITSGDNYDKILKVLKITSGEMFDISLFSSSLGENITELEDGSFEVKIPIKEEYKNKELKVYYVDDGKVEEYEVTISDDGKYAIFETNHFSIYTLAAGTETKNPKTGDNLILYILMLTGSAYVLYKVKKFN
ncbi:MAG: hypothetical protein K6E99_02360 [Bacilli bacterium]|nr:hypothetical protein [Bacilli bacterium]